MKKYVLNRLIAGALTVFFIATVTFVAMHLVPGDPISGQKAMRPEIRANIEKHYGLDKPVVVQYGIYLQNMFKGDFGISFTQQNRAVNDIIRDHFRIIEGARLNPSLGGCFGHCFVGGEVFFSGRASRSSQCI
jgi:ABC-type dipeptide/oligopeptide/nickel transport system permease component